MTVSSDLSKIILPFIEQFKGRQQLIAGDIANTACQGMHDTRSHSLTTPFKLDQLTTLPLIDVAIVSDLVESLPPQQAVQWLSKLRNQYAQHILMIVNESESQSHCWALTDYLALGLKRRGQVANFTLYTYEIENYQFKKDWLNSRYWANPENFDKYRW